MRLHRFPPLTRIHVAKGDSSLSLVGGLILSVLEVKASSRLTIQLQASVTFTIFEILFQGVWDSIPTSFKAITHDVMVLQFQRGCRDISAHQLNSLSISKKM